MASLNVGFIGLGIMGAPMAGHLLKGGHKLFVNTIGNVPAVVMVKDAKDRKCILLNRAGERLLGRDRSELIGRTGVAWMPEEDARIVEALEDEVRSLREAVAQLQAKP